MEWPELKRLFDLASDLPAGERGPFLDRECADPETRRQVRELLAESDAGAAKFLHALVIQDSAALAAHSPDGRAGEMIGPYRIERELGRGGMGEVFLARRVDQEFDKLVAVKIVRRGPDLAEVLRRFWQERQILARLEHPNIARMLDGGSTSDGLPCLVMEYVDGLPITEYCDSRGASIEDRCRLLLPVCDALRHAHRNLVVHRDLKPSNILVTAEGIPKLLDFGIAKLLESEPVAGHQTATMFPRPLTPDYASPEQILGRPATTATDVYLLGGVLFELFTGRKPHQITGYTAEEIERAVCHTPVPKPSQVKPEARRKLQGDLDNIVLRATHAEPEKRYTSVEQLAGDLERYLSHRPVLARPDSLRYRAGKWVRRAPLTAAALALVILITAGGVASTWYQARRAERRFQQVRNLAKSFVFDVHDQIATLPGATQARKTIVSTALTYLENLSEEAGGDTDVTREVAAAYIKIGTVQGDPVSSNLGDPAGAMRSYRRAEALLLPLNSRRDPATAKLLVSVYSRISALQRSKADAPAAIESIRLARRFVDQLLARLPGDAETLVAAVDLDLSLSRALRAKGDSRGAGDAARSALAAAEKLSASRPDDANLLAGLADAVSNLGVLQAQSGDLDSAAATYSHLVEVRERMVRASPQNVVNQRQLMIAYGHVGDVLGFRAGEHLGDFTGAAEVLRKAVAIAEWLVQQDPSDEKARFDLASAELRFGTVLWEQGQAAEGLARLEGADRLNTPLLRKNGANGLYLANSLVLKTTIAEALVARGRNTDAVRLARQALADAQAGVASGLATPSQVLHSQLGLAIVLARANLVDEAGQVAARLGSTLEGDPKLVRTGWLRAYFYGELGRIYRTGQPQQARVWLTKSRDAWKHVTGGPRLSAYREAEIQRLDSELARIGPFH
ncbi:MAG TPA: serine/threonine-protein kinase [Bryobacteraceae bacterium]|nr:serine/threonine-protein kinase [Bryobacteraceae bacterium]